MEPQFKSASSSPAGDHEESFSRPLSQHDHDQEHSPYGRDHRNGGSHSRTSDSPAFAPDDYRSPPAQDLHHTLDGDDLPPPGTRDSHLGGQYNLAESSRESENGTLEPQETRPQAFSQVDRACDTSTPLVQSDPDFIDGTHKSQKPGINFSSKSTDRGLPSRNVTEESVEDAFVAFILHCNPSVPLDTDTTELRKAFRTPPRSDGKTFGTFTLLDLIRKLETGEIRTWTQLVLDLGVEPPLAEKNQSVQKVQQYAVRLKRWLHAMHLDAFSAYCLGKYHGYYTQVPVPESFNGDFSRDGVPPEEDLALRALHPESRPKRGRRKTEKESEPDGDVTPSKRLRLDTSVPAANLEGYPPAHSALFPSSAMPPTSHPDFLDRFDDQVDPWAAASAVTPADLAAYKATPSYPLPSTPGGQQFRWRLNGPEQTPTTPHPFSAITPSSVYPTEPAFAEPQSALPPSSIGRPKMRRRHGPAVSSAWPSSAGSSTGKQRGRPPGSRSTRDGPYGTFPLLAKDRDGSILEPLNGTVSTPGANGSLSSPRFPTPPAPSSGGGNIRPGDGRPSRLYLQVPHGATPPVTQLPAVSIPEGPHSHSTATPPTRPSTSDLFHSPAHHLEAHPQQRDPEATYTIAELEQDIAVRFLQVEPDHKEAVAFDEAQALSRSLVQSLRALPSSSPHEHTFLGSAIAWLGASTTASPVRRMLDGLRIRRSQKISNDNDTNNRSQNATNFPFFLYELSWVIRQGPLSGIFSMTITLPSSPSYGSSHPNPISGSEAPGLGLNEVDARDRISGAVANRSSTPISSQAVGSADNATAIKNNPSADSGKPTPGPVPSQHQCSLPSALADRSELLAMERKLREKEEEINRLRRKVLDAVL